MASLIPTMASLIPTMVSHRREWVRAMMGAEGISSSHLRIAGGGDGTGDVWKSVTECVILCSVPDGDERTAEVS